MAVARIATKKMRKVFHPFGKFATWMPWSGTSRADIYVSSWRSLRLGTPRCPGLPRILRVF
jgi:hypothetical protein